MRAAAGSSLRDELALLLPPRKGTVVFTQAHQLKARGEQADMQPRVVLCPQRQPLCMHSLQGYATWSWAPLTSHWSWLALRPWSMRVVSGAINWCVHMCRP